ncbi:MAG: 4-(cytidine 5'-diphospho)-2-C-methyl-D-erythritol kinase [Candidatus Omnitrophica bacterium]|nr:4-(cytidine 5'-diphospho)-2-C-methyl-D-erythritol kinase [Candidatus Omnitrophota bacterium]
MKRIHLCSPAKLNLSLKVLGKRPDGYHNLSTLFEKINLCDDIDLTCTKTGKIRIACNHPAVPKGERNLAYQAAQMLKEDFGIANGVDIKIVKRIPVAGGLAGGSSNAATTLLGLNKIWQLDLTKEKLLSYAKRIGSDVPLFIYDYIFCHGTERGDRIKEVKIDRKFWHILVTPRLKVYSKEVFKALKIRLTKKADNANILTCALRENDVQTVSQYLSNDLGAAIVRVHPQLFKIKNNIKSISGLDVCFSGSGPSMFAMAPTFLKAKEVAHRLAQRYKDVIVVRTL